MHKALVTGASGFIGSTLVEELGQRGYEVHALLRRTSDISNLKGLTYRRIEGDLSDSGSLERAVQGMDYVFHLAGAVVAPTREQFFKHNVEGTRRLADAVSRSAPALRRFVQVSSLAAAGPASSLENPRTESQPESPVSAYGQSKLHGEHEALRYKDRFPLTIIRPPMVYGPKDKGVFVMIRTVSKKWMPLVRGSKPGVSKHYSLIHSRDLCRGIIQAAEVSGSKVPSGEVFFLSDGRPQSYRDLMLGMARSLGVRPRELGIPPIAVTAAAGVATALSRLTGKTYALNWDKRNEVLADYWICSDEKAKMALGFSPQYDLSKGLDDAIGWYRANGWL